jgi:hypothetical protein
MMVDCCILCPATVRFNKKEPQSTSSMTPSKTILKVEGMWLLLLAGEEALVEVPGFDVDDDNEPAPENIPQKGETLKTVHTLLGAQ